MSESDPIESHQTAEGIDASATLLKSPPDVSFFGFLGRLSLAFALALVFLVGTLYGVVYGGAVFATYAGLDTTGTLLLGMILGLVVWALHDFLDSL